MKTTLPILSLLAACFLAPADGLCGNLLVNGSFEQPVVSSNLNFIGSFSFPGWSASSTGAGNGGGNAGITVGTDFGLAPFNGNQAFSFNGDNPPAGTYLEQTFPTTAGLQYTVSFAVGRNNGFPDQILELQSEVFGSVGDQLALQLSFPPSTIGWSQDSFTFVADSSSSRLRFTDISGSNPNTDLFVDGVSVSAVPEPDTLSLLLVCGAGWLFLNQARTRE
jgi:hypothetical protein